MSLIPAFEIGVWNAWLFMAPFLLVTLLCMLLMMKKDAPGGSVRKVQRACKSNTTLLVASLSKIIYLPAVIYSVFLPLKLGSTWFYVGLPIALLGLVGTTVILVDWVKTPAGEPVTRGIYRYSRHPMYVTGGFHFLGVSILSASWVFLLFTIIFGVGVTRPYFVKVEEAQCLGHYGTAYREYIDRTPRWMGMPESGGSDRQVI
jgi:protein-S-isoprenylcysteine O-methyltransferase Ste14